MKNEERLTRLEAKIAIIEEDLQELKKEVALIKGSKEVESTTSNPIFCTSLEDMNLSAFSYNCLKRAGINTAGELLALSEEKLMQFRNFGKKPYEEIMDKIKKLVAADAETRKTAQVSDFEMSKKLLPAIEAYASIRTKAREEGIMFNTLGRYGQFPNWYRMGIIHIKKALDEGRGIIGIIFLQRILNGEYPKMKELLDAETINLDLAKATIIEDVTEACRHLGKQTNTYHELLRFVQLIQKYSEKW